DLERSVIMSGQRSSFVPLFPALGLAFGAGAGLLACAAAGASSALGLLAGGAARRDDAGHSGATEVHRNTDRGKKRVIIRREGRERL
ncbi:MAG TPA: hypothetical protein PLB62_03410, partial [Candidatus Sumerlaeota bacterium]|nr:hypothetical protein [Candidatus Sumerlaeota bacterium]